MNLLLAISITVLFTFVVTRQYYSSLLKRGKRLSLENEQLMQNMRKLEEDTYSIMAEKDNIIKAKDLLIRALREVAEDEKNDSESMAKQYRYTGNMADFEKNAKAIMNIMKSASEIMKEQTALKDAIQKPSTNSLHSKYKNSLGIRYKELEDAKYDKLSQILKLGFDPDIKVLDENGNVKISKISDFVSDHNKENIKLDTNTELNSLLIDINERVITKGNKTFKLYTNKKEETDDRGTEKT